MALLILLFMLTEFYFLSLLGPISLVKNHFFTRNYSWNIYKMTFSGYFFLQGKQKSQLRSHAEPTHCTRSLQKPWLWSNIIITFALIATTHWHWKYLFLDNPVSSHKNFWNWTKPEVIRNTGMVVAHNGSSHLMDKLQSNGPMPGRIHWVYYYIIKSYFPFIYFLLDFINLYRSQSNL